MSITGSDLLTNSRMMTFRQCQRKHWFAYELGVRPRGVAKPLRMGSAIHEGLDYRARGFNAVDAIALATRPYDELPGWATTDELVFEWNIERVTVACMLQGYFWYWENAAVPDNLNPASVIESEAAFSLPIVNPETGKATPTFKSAGKRDQIVTLADGRVAIMEHKSCSESLDADSDYWRRLRIDQQISHYLVSALDQGHDVQTIVYDVLRKPCIAPKQIPDVDADGFKIVIDGEGRRVYLDNGKPRQSADSAKGWALQSRTETAEEFAERLMEDIGERPEFYYARQEIPRLAADIAEYRQELWWTQQAIRDAQKSGRWIRNTGACLMHGRCPYLDICHAGIGPDAPLPDKYEYVTDLHPELAAGEPE